MKFPAAPVLLADGPQLDSWQVAVMRVDETPAGDAPGRKCPHAEQNRQRPIDVCEVTGNVRPVFPAGGSPLAGVVNPACPDGPVVAGGPVGPCEMLSPYSEKTQEPLEQAVLIQAHPAGQSAAVGTLSPSDCYPVGPAGPCVAGGPVGPDVCFKDPEPLTHAVLIMLTRLVSTLLLLGRCPHLTVTLLAQLAPMLQGALLAQVIVYKFWNRSSNWFWTMLTQADSMPLFWILQNR